MKICGSESCGKAVAVANFVAAAVLVALACLFASGTLHGHAAYYVAIGCALGALATAIVGSFLYLDN